MKGKISRLLSVLFIQILLIIAVFPASARAVSAEYGVVFPAVWNPGTIEIDYYISNKAELEYFAAASHENNLAGISVHMIADIDWGGQTGGSFAGIGVDSDALGFSGSFDGHGYTLTGLYSETGGLFNCIGSEGGLGTVKNVVLDGAQMTASGGGKAILVSKYYGFGNIISGVMVENSTGSFSDDSCAAIAAVQRWDSNSSVLISNCVVDNTNLFCTANTTTPIKQWGMIIGYDLSAGKTRVTDCTVKNSTISSEKCNFSYTGIMFGHTTGAVQILNSSVENCQLISGLKDDNTGRYTELLGGVIGRLNGSGKIEGCRVSGSTVKTEGLSRNIGMITGYTASSSHSGNSVSGSHIILNSDTAASEINIGLYVGCVKGSANFTDCAVAGSDIKITGKELRSIGGFIGESNVPTDSKATTEFINCRVEGVTVNLAGLTERAGLFCGFNTAATLMMENCSVSGNSTLNITYNTDNTKRSNYLGGLCGLNNGEASFTGCTVASATINTKFRYQYAGGLIGQTNAKTVIDKCYVTEIKLTTTDSLNILQGGGLLAHAGADANVSMTDCGVAGFESARNVNAQNVGGLVGKIDTVNFAMKNCFIDTAKLSGNANIGPVVGYALSTAGIENCWYGNITREGVAVNTDAANTYEASTADFASGLVAYNLNTSGGTADNSGVWMQGVSVPILKTPDGNAAVKVVFHYNDREKTVFTRSDGSVIVPAADVSFKWLMPENYFTADTDIYSSVALRGDANGDEIFDVKDLVRVKKYMTGMQGAEVVVELADYNSDNQINAFDLTCLRKNLLYGADWANGLFGFSVMSYNVYYLEAAARKDNITGLITRENPDLLGLQEVSAEWLPYLKQFILDNGYECYGYGRFGGQMDDNNLPTREQFAPVLWKKDKFELTDSGHFWCSSTPEVYSAQWEDGTESAYPRCVNWVKLREKSTGYEFVFLNIHTDPENALVRTYSSRLVVEKLKEIGGSCPAVMTGDWNMNMRDDAYGAIVESDFRDVRYVATETSATGSFNNWDRFDAAKYAFGDYIFASNGVMSDSFRVVDDVYEGAHISDHCPVMTNVFFIGRQ